MILEFDGREIESYADLPRQVAATPPGAEVTIVVARDGKRKKLEATLDEMEKPEIQRASLPTHSSEWGFEIEELTSEARENLGLEGEDRGVLITSIDPDSPVAESLRRGDIILEANHQAIRSLDDLDEQLSSNEDRLLLLVQRGDGTVFVVVRRS